MSTIAPITADEVEAIHDANHLVVRPTPPEINEGWGLRFVGGTKWRRRWLRTGFESQQAALEFVREQQVPKVRTE